MWSPKDASDAHVSTTANTLSPAGGLEPVPQEIPCAQVRENLTSYQEGVLAPERARQIDAHLARCAECRSEMKALRAEDDLLNEALSDLRPSESMRFSVSRMCSGMHKRVETIAEAIPERGWLIFRWSLGVGLFNVFALLLILWPRVTPERGSVNVWINVGVFAVSLFLLLGVRMLASMERWFGARLGHLAPLSPMRLEVVALETLGVLGALVTAIFLALQFIRAF